MRNKNGLRALVTLFLVVFALPVPAQEISLDNLDFSEAHLHLAGPDSFYLRGVGMGAREVSLRVETTDGRGWQVTRVFDEDENLIPRGMMLDFATATRVGERRIRVEGLFLEGTAYGGTLDVRRDGTIVPVPGTFAESDPTLYNSGRGDPLLELILDLAGLRAAEQELAELRAEHEALAAGQVGLAMERDRLEKEREILRERVRRLDLENQQLQRELEALETATRPEAPTTDGSAPPETGGLVPAPAPEGFEVLTAEIARLADEIRTLRIGLAETPAPVTSPEDVEEEIARLRRENDRLRRQVMDAGYEAFAVDRTAGFVRLARDQLTEPLLSGFSSGGPQIGDWDITLTGAVQRDSDQFFAKMTIPLEDVTGPTLYEFAARTLDPGWVGLGMHIEVSNVELRGYGLGKSMLIWFTRDRDAYGHELTHLQIYRSDDDVNMERVADAVIPEVLSEFRQIGILYEPTTRYITISVDGVDRLRSSTWFDIDSGASIALRSLGAAEFRNLSVSGRP
ncbi:MAG: hypothetical protein ACOCW6_08660 [Spirochaetota bacterium]